MRRRTAAPFLALTLLASPAVAMAGPTKTTTHHAKPTPTTPGPRPTAAPEMPKLKPAKYLLSVQIVRTADDDGGRGSTLTQAAAEAAILRANQVYRRNGGDVQFALHPASNFDALLRSTPLNRDCILAPGQSGATINGNTNGDVDGDGQVGTDADRDRLCDKTTATNARTAYAVERADRIIVYSRGGNDSVGWDSGAGHWVFSQPTGGASSANGFYVRMPKQFGNDTLLAHEIGHYLHTAHTFGGSNPKTVAEAKQAMERWAADHAGEDPRKVFDGDSRTEYSVHDTPPDPRKSLLMAVHGDDGCDPDPAKGRVTIPVKVGSTTTNYVLEPDRALVMSYFKGCAGFNHYQSKGQYARIHEALTVGNRRGLVEQDEGSCYSSSHAPGELATTDQQLAAVLRKVSRCLLLHRRPLPWEPVIHDVYRALDRVGPGFAAKGGVAVHAKREKALLSALRSGEVED